MNGKSSAVRSLLLSISGFLLSGVIHTLVGQDQPRNAFPSEGSEVVLVFISDSRCSGNSEEHLDDAIRQAKVELSERLEAEGHAFYSIGAAVQWSVQDGVEYLLNGVSPGYSDKDFGPWDEIWVGRHWLNNAAVEHIWRGDRRSIIPQLIVIQRPVTWGESGFEVGEEQVIARVVGSRQIVQWFNDGLPVALR